MNWNEIVFLNEGRSFGCFQYESWKLIDGFYHFRLFEEENTRERLEDLLLEDDCQLEAAVEIPEELKPDYDPEKISPSATDKGRDRPFVGGFSAKRIDIHRLAIILEPNERDDEELAPPPESGFLFHSLHGDQTRVNRRKKAELAIRNASCPIPQLGLILEERAVPTASHRNIEPFSPKLKRKFKDRPFTSRQQNAIRIALNTPDIALIQGPPGTGKTTVITALETRLAELADSKDGISGLILLSSYQHDAVENAAERTEINGIPAMKFGRRNKASDDVEVEKTATNWARERMDKIMLQIPTLPENSKYMRMQSLIQGYILSPGSDIQTAKLLEQIYDLSKNLVPGSLRSQLQQWQVKFNYSLLEQNLEDEQDAKLIMVTIRGIRTEAISFGDDGPIKARKALARLKSLDLIETQEVKLLEDAADWVEDTPPPFLKQLEQLQKNLLERLTPDRRPQTATFSNVDIQKLLTEILEAAAETISKTKDGISNVLSEYLHDLQHDPQGIRDTLMEYNAVYAATCQQAGNKYLFNKVKDDLSYDTVLIDEAARSNPLDLFIPMSQAKRRIILVGDHRQLPQMLEPSIEREMEVSFSERTREALRKSLFEKLFLYLRELEKKDGIPRTVTLDVQYRMPKILGDFVSKQFYEVHGESKIETGISENDRQHNLLGYMDEQTHKDRVAAWINVPLSDGAEHKSRGETSWRRSVEAQRVAEEVKKLLEQTDQLTIGIITFYTAQKRIIEKHLCNLGIMERTDDGEYEVLPRWQIVTTKSGKRLERIRIGTVDAFQGREFDVVLLSMTRSNNYSDKTEKERRRKYGHLMLPNRLCVAMSRQMRLLIVVGDAGMLQSHSAEQAIGPLVAFHKLCEEPYGVCL